MIKTILLTIGFLILIEGLIILIFPKSVGKNLKKISSKKKLTKAATLEIIVSLILIIIGFIIG